MMTSASSLMDRLLGLTKLSWSDAQAGLGWRHTLPGWVWVVVAIGAAALAGWSYSRLAGRRGGRAALAVVRFALMMVIVALLAGPRLILPQELIEPDTLVLLVDRSASMQIQDERLPGGPDTGLVSRTEALQAALSRNPDLFGPKMLGRERRVEWLGFDVGAYPIPAPTAPQPHPPQAQGEGTALGTALEQVLERTAGRPIGGIVLFTDGRSPQPTGQHLIHRLQQAVATVFTVPMGDPVGAGDLAIRQVVAPDAAFVGDAVPVTVWLDVNDAGTPDDLGDIKVTLRDVATQAMLGEQSVAATSISEPVQLTGISEAVGPVEWRVDVRWADGTDATPGRMTPARRRTELVQENNHRKIDIKFVDRPIKVLYVEGSPRWEYRYLKGVLTREESITSSVLLVSADRDFVQEGNRPITGFPQDPEELLEYDVVIIGDVAAAYFEPSQMEMLRDHVAAHGLGLIWIGGPNHTPASYLITPVVDLLPMRRSARASAAGGAASISGSITVAPTPLADSLQVMRLDEIGKTNPRLREDWVQLLPPVTWAQAIEPLVPAAEVLAVGRRDDAEDVPLVTRLRYGAGQSVYVATDETWRWRFGVGDGYFERFWVQLVRMLGRNRLQGGAHETMLTVSSRRIELGQSVVVRLRVAPDALGASALTKVAVEVIKPTAKIDPSGPPTTGSTRVGMLELRPANFDQDRNLAVKRTEYQGAWRPGTAGPLTLRVAEPALADIDLQASVEVIRPDDELRHPLPDHQRLGTLAESTGGQAVPLDRLGDLAELIPNRARRTPNDISEPLWDSPLSFLVVILLLAVEWVGRKVIRLI